MSYTIESWAGYRYIRNWDLFGLHNGKKYLIDRQTDHIFCETAKLTCPENITETFYCQYPGYYNQFIFVLSGPDSLGEDMLSMTAIKFYGLVTSSHSQYTYRQNCRSIRFFILLTALIN